MRNTTQRTQAALLGAKRLKQKQVKRRRQAMVAGCYAASLCVVVVLAGVIASVSGTALDSNAVTGYEGSMFASASVHGYIAIASISFILGVCATVFCALIRKKNQEEGDDVDD